jgi:hypothetical protein
MYVELTYTTQPDQTHAHETSVAGELSTAGGYTVGGHVITLIDVAISGTDPTVYVVFDAVNTEWASPFTAGPCRYAVTYENNSAPTTDALFSFHDFGEDKTGGGGTFTVKWNDLGVARIQITDAA